jgi:hypothetical protein
MQLDTLFGAMPAFSQFKNPRSLVAIREIRGFE